MFSGWHVGSPGQPLLYLLVPVYSSVLSQLYPSYSSLLLLVSSILGGLCLSDVQLIASTVLHRSTHSTHQLVPEWVANHQGAHLVCRQ